MGVSPQSSLSTLADIKVRTRNIYNSVESVSISLYKQTIMAPNGETNIVVRPDNDNIGKATEEKDDDYNAQCYAMLCYQQNPDFRKFVRKLSNCKAISSLDVESSGENANKSMEEVIQRKLSIKATEEDTTMKKKKSVNKIKQDLHTNVDNSESMNHVSNHTPLMKEKRASVLLKEKMLMMQQDQKDSFKTGVFTLPTVSCFHRSTRKA